MNIYQENILEHNDNPRNYGHLEHADVKAHDSNPLCGDSFDMEFKFKGGRLVDICFHGHGCAISKASASMLTEKVKKMKIGDIEKIDKDDILKMIGIELSYARLKCALLPLKILKMGLYKYIGKVS